MEVDLPLACFVGDESMNIRKLKARDTWTVSFIGLEISSCSTSVMQILLEGKSDVTKLGIEYID